MCCPKKTLNNADKIFGLHHSIRAYDRLSTFFQLIVVWFYIDTAEKGDEVYCFVPFTNPRKKKIWETNDPVHHESLVQLFIHVIVAVFIIWSGVKHYEVYKRDASGVSSVYHTCDWQIAKLRHVSRLF